MLRTIILYVGVLIFCGYVVYDVHQICDPTRVVMPRHCRIHDERDCLA